MSTTILSPTIAENVAGAGVNWVDPSNALTDDSTYASVEVLGLSGNLKLKTFEAAIPSTVVIVSLIVTIKGYASVDTQPNDGNIVYLRLADGTLSPGVEFSFPMTTPDEVEIDLTDDATTIALSADDINDPDFAIEIVASSDGIAPQHYYIGSVTLSIESAYYAPMVTTRSATKPMPKKENILEIKVTILDKRQSAA
jgi:hypothetical protein